MNLRDLPKAQPARVSGFQTPDAALETRLREIGFAEGDRVECLQRGLIGGNPIMIKLNGALIAMRKREAQAVLVEAI